MSGRQTVDAHMSGKLSVQTLVVGQMATNCHIAYDTVTRDGIIIDAGDDPEYISDTLTRLRITPILLVSTHGHFDHNLGAFALQHGYGIPFAIHPDDRFLLDTMQQSAKHFLGIPYADPPPIAPVDLSGMGTIRIGTAKLSVFAVPGHTPGSVCLYAKDMGLVFTGDTIFADGAVGRTDRSYGDARELRRSVKRILRLPPETKILSGHGAETSVLAERVYHGV